MYRRCAGKGWLLALMAGSALLDAQDLKFRFERGLAAAGKGDCQVAVSDLTHVVAAEPRLVPAHNAIGVCQARQGRPALAVRSFLQVVKLEPEIWQGWLNLASAQLELGSDEDAFTSLDRAQRLAPGNPKITTLWLDTAGRLATRAADLIEQKRYAKACALLAAVRRPLENSASWHNLLGYAEFKLGRSETASRHLEKALQLEPDNEDFLLDAGEFLAHHRAYDKAEAFFKVAMRRMPHSPRVRFGLAVAHILQNKRPEATSALEELLAENPRFEAVYRALGECYEDAGNWSGLVELGRGLQHVNARNAVGWYLEGVGLGRLAVEQQASSLPAIAALERAVSLDPGTSRYHFTLAKACQEAQQLNRAIAELNAAIQLEPQHERAHYVLGRLYMQVGKAEMGRRELAIHSGIKAKDRKSVYGALLLRPSHGASAEEQKKP
jgi:tetratricopeptide (TPR) repeat protein